MAGPAEAQFACDGPGYGLGVVSQHLKIANGAAELQHSGLLSERG
jgi:hypothetical protein